MKQTYKSIKAYSSTLQTLDWIIAKLNRRGYHLSKVQALALAAQQLKKSIEKIKSAEDE